MFPEYWLPVIRIRTYRASSLDSCRSAGCSWGNLHVISSRCRILLHQHCQSLYSWPELLRSFLFLHPPQPQHHICQYMWQITSDSHNTSSLSVTLKDQTSIWNYIRIFWCNNGTCSFFLMSSLFMHLSEAISAHWQPAVLNNNQTR